MVLENLQVRHKAFGIGTVISVDGKYLGIQFECGVKSFVYPDAFEKFLTLADGTVSEEILADLAESRARKEQILAKKQQENLHSMTHGIVIPGKETSVDDEEDQSDKNSDTEDN